MHAIWNIARREFSSYFNSPIAYIAITVFLVLAGLQFFYGFTKCKHHYPPTPLPPIAKSSKWTNPPNPLMEPNAKLLCITIEKNGYYMKLLFCMLNPRNCL